MATDTITPEFSYEDHIADLQEWLTETANNLADNPEGREWCTLNMTDSLVASNIYPYFDNSGLNDNFQTEYDNVTGTDDNPGNYTNIPIMYNQSDSDNIDALSKMFIYRHQPRLKNYRDDIENKGTRTYSSLSLGLARYALLKNLNS